jgi:hypothetical protein
VSDFCPRCAPAPDGLLDASGSCGNCGYDVATEARDWAGEGYAPEDAFDYEDALAQDGLSSQRPTPWLKLGAILAGIGLLLYVFLSSLGSR